ELAGASIAMHSANHSRPPRNNSFVVAPKIDITFARLSNTRKIAMSRWDQEYRSLSEGTRAAVNDLVNTIFQQETGFQGKINPHTQPELARKWMTIRDNVLANRVRFAHWLNRAGSALVDFALAIPI